MPNEFIPLTPEEKNALIAKHINLIGEFNRHLPEGQKLVYNAQEFNARLDDPAEVEQYRKGLARAAKLSKQEEIHNQMIQRHGEPPKDRHYLNRVIRFGFKTEDTAEAKAYNEKMYSEYCANPEKVLYQRMQRLVNFNPATFVDNLGDNRSLIDFYDANQELIEDAFAFESIAHNARDILSPAFRDAIPCIKKPLESLNEAQKRAFAAAGEEYLTLPKLTPEQALAIMNGNPQYMAMDDDNLRAVRNYLNLALEKMPGVDNAPNFYDRLQAAGWRPDSDFFVRHVVEERDPQTGAVKEVSADRYFANRPNVTMRERTQEEMWHIRNISREVETRYHDKWAQRFQANTGRELNVDAIENAHKGGFWERMLGKTSPEYTEFIRTFRAYNDPNSKDFNNRDKLRSAAMAYKVHKLGDGTTIDQLDATGKGRMELVDGVINTIDDMIRQDAAIRREIEAEAYGIPAPRVGQPFLNREDVDPARREREIFQQAGEAVANMEVNDDLNNSLDNSRH